MEQKKTGSPEDVPPAGGRSAQGTMTDDELIDEESEESFPSSDPPSFTPTRGPGNPHR